MDLLNEVILVASGEVGVRETSRNRGPMVDAYIESVGLDPAIGQYPWCASFVFWCYEHAAKNCSIVNPCPKTASALKLWLKSPEFFRLANFSDKICPGCIFIIDHGHGKGHCGIVEGVDFTTQTITTIEGNTNPEGGREGDGVYRRSRTLQEINVGFLRFTS